MRYRGKMKSCGTWKSWKKLSQDEELMKATNEHAMSANIIKWHALLTAQIMQGMLMLPMLLTVSPGGG